MTNDGNSPITARGVVWGATANPTTALATKVTASGTTGAYTVSATGLTPNTTYHFRAYSTNSIGTSYGTDVSFTTAAIVYDVSSETHSHTEGGATVNFGTTLPTNTGSGFNLTVIGSTTSLYDAPAGKSLVKLYDITPSLTLTGSYVATITLDYPAGTTYKEGDTVMYWDTSASPATWSSSGVTVTGHTTNTITFTTTHFSEFAVFSNSTSGTPTTLPVTGGTPISLLINLFITTCLYLLFRSGKLLILKKS